jgi:hypothetical protein
MVPPRMPAIGLILPLTLRAASEQTAGIRGALDHLTALPEGQHRGAAFYRSGLFMRQTADEAGTRPELGADAKAPVLRTPALCPDGFRFAADIKEASREDYLAAEPGELLPAMLQRLKSLKQPGHVGVVLNGAVSRGLKPELYETLRLSCAESGCAVHVFALGVVSPQILSSWLQLGRATGGYCSALESEEELPAAVAAWTVWLEDIYKAEFEAPAITDGETPDELTVIRVEVVDGRGTGSVSVPVTLS